MMDDQYSQAFKEEAEELLGQLESSLLELEETPDDMDLVAKVFRAMHTIKGSGAMFGFDEISRFTHEVETVYDLVRNGKLEVSKELINLSLSARDHICSLLADGEGESGAAGHGETLIASFQNLIPGKLAAPQKAVAVAPEPEEAEGVTYRIRLTLPENIILSGTRPDSLLRELNDLGSCRVVAQGDRIPLLDELVPESCHVYWDVILTTDRGVNAIKDVFIFIEEDIDLRIDEIDDNLLLDEDPDYKRLGEILVDRGDLSQDDLNALLAEAKPLGQKLIDTSKVPADKIEAALQEQQLVRTARNRRQSKEAESSVRVPAERLDDLVNMVGELVTVKARLARAAALLGNSELTEIAEEVERLTDELRDNSLTMRMLPIGATFSKFKRLVRDLSAGLGKNVELKTEGAETEIDKTVIEKLNDPLVHLIRNCLDHGIESPEERAAAGKPKVGTVVMTAGHVGDYVEITIKDDGRGLDREAILAKGIERGLVTADAELSDQQIFELIFAAGFSTARKITDVSGRGVGMDVVKQAIDGLRGAITIASQPQQGTTINIRIPLTLAIVESLLVRIGEETYAIPLSIVEECVELAEEKIEKQGRHLINVRGKLVPYIPLREQFATSGRPGRFQQIIITRQQGNRVGFVVDQVIGQHQSVIKTLGRMYKDLKAFSGATILGDGSVALILDVNHLFRQVEQGQGQFGTEVKTIAIGQ